MSFEPPLMDKARGIVYFRCPEWYPCGECYTACAFNPNTPYFCHQCQEWMPKRCRKKNHKTERR